jgi:hypothetical protein
MGLEALDPQHFYTTDFFQQSSFHSTPMQVVSVYYSFSVADPLAIPAAIEPFHGLRDDGQEVFRWLDLQRSVEEDLSLPIDRWVWRLLRSGPRAHGPDLS